MGKHIWDEPAKDTKKVEAVAETAVADAEKLEQEYIHTPGTPHINAFIADVKDCEQKVAGAVAELEAAKARLEQKKAESGIS